ncbi:hypothetical protein MASR1M65_18720 [Saprospiraceae bacterium]
MLKELAKKTDLEVCYFSDVSLKLNKDAGFGTAIKWDIPLLEGYQSEFLKNWRSSGPLTNSFFDVFNPSVITKLWKTKHKIVVVNGWSYSSNWLVFIFGKLFGKKIWMRAENPLHKELTKSPKLLFIKKIILKHILFKLFIDKFLYIGSQNKAFYQFYGVNEESRYIFTPYAVDNKQFQTEKLKFSKNINELKTELQVDSDKKIILFSGKYIEVKRPLDLLEAFKMLNNPDYLLIFVGEGKLRKQMEDYVKQNGLQNVLLTGFVNQSQISKYYAIANVFVMCSEMETWGLSLNEAMNFELPVVISSTCGSSFDLVKDGVNGYIFQKSDVNELAKKIESVLLSEENLRKMGKESLEIINQYSIDVIVENIKKQIN